MGHYEPETEDEQDLMTAEEVTEHLLTVELLKRFASTCILPAIRQDGEWKFRRSDLEAWIRQQKQSR